MNKFRLYAQNCNIFDKGFYLNFIILSSIKGGVYHYQISI